MKKIIILSAVFLLIMFFSGVGAQEAKKGNPHKKEPAVSSQVKQIEGEVSNISKRSISISFSRNVATGSEEEMLFKIDPQTIKVEHKQSFSDIALGDTVLVVYREEISDYGDRQDMKLKADVIRFLKPADAQSVYKPKAAATEEALVTGETPVTEGLSLKGVK